MTRSTGSSAAQAELPPERLRELVGRNIFPQFSGKEDDVDNFISILTMRFDAMGIDNYNNRVTLLVTVVPATHATWANNNQQKFDDWEAFTAAFRAEILPTRTVSSTTVWLTTCKYKQGQSLQEFRHRLEQRARQLTPPLHPDAITMAFLNGLPAACQQAYAASHSSVFTIAEICKHAELPLQASSSVAAETTVNTSHQTRDTVLEKLEARLRHLEQSSQARASQWRCSYCRSNTHTWEKCYSRPGGAPRPPPKGKGKGRGGK